MRVEAGRGWPLWKYRAFLNNAEISYVVMADTRKRIIRRIVTETVKDKSGKYVERIKLFMYEPSHVIHHETLHGKVELRRIK